MKKHLLPLLFLLSTAFATGMAYAEKADREKPMNIESDALRHDDLKQTSVFTGNVVMTKGSILIRGTRLDVRQDADGYQYGVVTADPGKRAFFHQRRDGPGDEFIEGEGETIEYDGRSDKVHFIRKAEMRRYRDTTLSDEIHGDVIVYDNVTDVFTTESARSTPSASNPSGRVRAVLAPKPVASSAATPASAAASASNAAAKPSSSAASAAAKAASAPASAASAPVVETAPALRQSTTIGGAAR